MANCSSGAMLWAYRTETNLCGSFLLTQRRVKQIIDDSHILQDQEENFSFQSIFVVPGSAYFPIRMICFIYQML